MTPATSDTDAAPVEARGLSKTYKVGFWMNREVQALQALDLTIPRGQIFGLLGPNGAGKSTTIKILLNLVQPSRGTARLFGGRPGDPARRRLVGFLPENPAPYAYLTGREFTRFAGQLAGLSGHALDQRVDAVLGQVEMSRAANIQIRRYSKGMVQRVALAQALIGDPKLLILDEPTSGLDPLGRRQIRDLILEQRARGITVLFCTHIIPDVEALCDHVAVLVGGRRVRDGSVAELLQSDQATVELVLEGLTEAQVRTGFPAALSVQTAGQQLLVKLPEAGAQDALGWVVAQKGRVRRLSPVRFGLEDLFMTALQEAGRTVGGDITG